MFFEGLQVRRCAIAFVPIKPILGVLRMQLLAPTVTMHFGQDRRR